MKYIDGQYYHIYNRGALKSDIFFEGRNYRFLIELFERYSARYIISFAAYCLMPNHYHLIVKQEPQGSLGNFLKTTFNAYTQSVNKWYSRSGTLFQGHAMNKHVDSYQYCVHLVRYIHRNPVKAGIVRSAEEWEFSDYRDWIDLRQNPLFKSELKDGYFGSGEKYREFVESYDDRRDDTIISKYLFNED